MDYNNLKEYMFQYVRQFLPYKDDELYQIVIKFLEDDFLYDLYVNVPDRFKVLFEEHTLNIYMYDVILRSLGFPRDMVESLPSAHKQIILSTFSDYYNRKGTFKLIKEICSAFNEPINLHELYVDFKYNSGRWDWWFVPKEVYCNIDKERQYDSYDDIYHATPTYFVSKQQLHNHLLAEKITLPIKTNLIKLSIQDQTNSDEINILTMMTTFHYFKDEMIEIQMKEGVYDVSLHGVYQLWNYLLSEYRGEVNTVEIDGEIVFYDISGETFPYTLQPGLVNSINSIINKYNALRTADEITNFYITYVEDVFRTSIPSTIHTISTLKKSVQYSVDSDLVSYVDEQIASATNITSEIILLLQELRNSIIIHIEADGGVLMQQYKNYILSMFEMSFLSPTTTTSYKMINFLKPFHTQLIAKKQQVVTNKSKFNNAGVLDSYRMFVIRDYPGTVYQISDDVFFMDRIDDTIILSEFYVDFTTQTAIDNFNIGDQILLNDEDCIANTGHTFGPIYDDIRTIKYNPDRTAIVGEKDGLRLIFENGFIGFLGTYNGIYRKYHITAAVGEILNNVD